jgi:hypothetical protein
MLSLRGIEEVYDGSRIRDKFATTMEAPWGVD